MNEKMISFFNDKAEGWDSNRDDKNRSIPIIAGLMGANENSKVLDIACGTGIMFDELIKLKVKKIVGIDISDKMIEIAKEKYKDRSNLEIGCSDLLDFNETGFDIALMYNAYPHFLEKERVIKHIYERLNKGGRFIIAHGSGKDKINQCHKNVPHDISTKLLCADMEGERLKKYFNVDILIDTPYLYVVSGISK